MLPWDYRLGSSMSLGRFVVLSSPEQGLGLENPACARPTASPSPGTPLPFLGNSAAASGRAPGRLWSTDVGHGHRAVSTVPSASSIAAFNLLSFPPKAADNPAYNGFRAPNASLQAAASQLQGQCVASLLWGRARAPSASPSTQIIPPGLQPG